MKISLCINSREPKPEFLTQLLMTTYGCFDEIIIYVDEATEPPNIHYGNARYIFDGKHRGIAEGFNHVISQASGEWVCSFCDDDYFLSPGLENLTALIRAGKYDQADVVFFPVELPGGQLWGTVTHFGIEQITSGNCIPHGSFMKKSAFDQVGGYRIDPLADWNIWIRMMRVGMQFEPFAKPVYHFRQHPESASNKQIKQYGHDAMRKMALETI